MKYDLFTFPSFKVDVNIENKYKQGQNIAESHIRKLIEWPF